MLYKLLAESAACVWPVSKGISDFILISATFRFRDKSRKVYTILQVCKQCSLESCRSRFKRGYCGPSVRSEIGKMMVVTIAAVLLSLVVAYTSATRACGNIYVWRNSNMSCPHDTTAVCADVFETRRNWYNGTTCDERRVLHNCMCPNNQICPVNDPNHRFYASAIHTRYLCQPKCSLNSCASFSGVFPLTTVYTAPEFGQRTYNKIDCLCPYHHSPAQAQIGSRSRSSRRGYSSGRRLRTVEPYGYYWDDQRNSDLLMYICNRGLPRQGIMTNPCNT
ncbi:hypothetical protein RRG08_052540 [Elysia crispata]|uniref:Uncharacterized protein n=1 Tax=Elysia crispata TaxID=231223 RepID=A0AAE0Z5Q5_9GAST|nr:hypothetical protein RRG08_052540 [Elysia crispata]